MTETVDAFPRERFSALSPDELALALAAADECVEPTPAHIVERIKAIIAPVVRRITEQQRPEVSDAA